MTEHLRTEISNHIGFITLDRPRALNSLTLEMIRRITLSLSRWKDDSDVRAVVIRSSNERAFCAGADLRFFHDAGRATLRSGAARIEDFFTEEYALNHLIHHYPKPYIAVMDGIVMGGGMGLSQSGPRHRMRIVTERTKMAMPEVNIGFFPDVGGSFFLSRTPGQCGVFLAVTGRTIGAADALYAGLADVFIPSSRLEEFLELLETTAAPEIRDAVRDFAALFEKDCPEGSLLASRQETIDRHFSYDDVPSILSSLEQDSDAFARETLALMEKASPLMMCVALAQVRRGRTLGFADSLRMERGMARRCFEDGEILEGIRALVIDKDRSPQWNPPDLEAVTPERVEEFFTSPWPPHAHPLRALGR